MVFLRHQFYKLTDNQYSYIFLFNDSKLATNQKKPKMALCGKWKQDRTKKNTIETHICSSKNKLLASNSAKSSPKKSAT